MSIKIIFKKKILNPLSINVKHILHDCQLLSDYDVIITFLKSTIIPLLTIMEFVSNTIESKILKKLSLFQDKASMDRVIHIYMLRLMFNTGITANAQNDCLCYN